ncbi:MAG TPA: DUF4870 domain-containing protein [Caulobacteraceae bacterium]|jgi:uncharacterized membrane protein
MSDIDPAPGLSGPPASGVMNDVRQMPFIVYILYLAHFVPVVGWVAAIVGLVLAYVERDHAPDWLKSHYTLQIRTFWIGLLYFAIACLLCFIAIGVPLLFAAWVWFIVRCALGLSRLLRNEAYPTPLSWTF